jgi:hypothetical protein
VQNFYLQRDGLLLLAGGTSCAIKNLYAENSAKTTRIFWNPFPGCTLIGEKNGIVPLSKVY